MQNPEGAKGLFGQSLVHPLLNFLPRLVLGCVAEGRACWLGSEEEEEDVLMVPFKPRAAPDGLCWVSARGCCSARVCSPAL